MSEDTSYIVDDLRRMMVRVGANEHWYKQSWLGVPVWQIAEDLLRLQKAVWCVRPRWIVETGTKFGGSAVFFSSLLSLLGHADGGVITIDIEKHNIADETFASHPLARMIHPVIGDAASPATVKHVLSRLPPVHDRGPVLVFLDDNHNAAHVSAEMELFAPLVSLDSHLIVADTVFEDLVGTPLGRATGKYPDMAKSNPRVAVRQFLARRTDFVTDTRFGDCGQSNFSDGFLRRIA